MTTTGLLYHTRLNELGEVKDFVGAHASEQTLAERFFFFNRSKIIIY